MKKLAIADYEAASDKGNMRFYPNGRLIKSLLEKYVTDEVVKYGGSEDETPITYDSDFAGACNFPCIPRWLMQHSTSEFYSI